MTPATLDAHLLTNRPRHYPSDTSDAEWAILAPHVPVRTGRGWPIIYPRRDIVDAIRYLAEPAASGTPCLPTFPTTNSSTTTSRPGPPTAP